MIKEDLIELRNRVLSYKNIPEEEKRRVLTAIDNGQEYGFNTGYASIDRPWLSSYRKGADVYSENFPLNQTVWNATESLLQKYSDVNFIEYFGRNISRETFAKYVEMWARTFRALGVKKNELVPIYAPAIPEAFAMFFALNSIGAIPYYQKIAISNKALEEETIGAKVAVVFDGLWKNVSNVFSKDRFKNVIVLSAADSMMFPLKQITSMKSYFDNKKSDCKIPDSPKYIWANKAKKISNYFTGDYKTPYEPEQTAIITTSSGTTSHVVKGIMDTNEGILASLACTINADTGYIKGKRTLTCFPPTASTSINCLQLLPTFTGGTIIFDPRVDINQWYNQLFKYKPDITISTGSVWEKYIQDLLAKEKKTGKKADLSWQDYFVMGGSGTTPDILNNMNTIIRDRGAKRDFQVGYGFSEVFGVLSVAKYNGNYKESENNKPVIGVGIPLPGYNVGLFDENGNELKYGSGNRGELWIKAPSNMQGYFNKKELTNNTVVDGWIHSGDLCEIGPDGTIYVYGRLKNHFMLNNKKEFLFDISNSIRDSFNLHDAMLEKKVLDDGTISLNLYFVQKEETCIDSSELIRNIDAFLEERNIVIDGYKEFQHSLPIDPTTLKPRTKDADGFIKYKMGEKYLVSYDMCELDKYIKNENKVKEIILKK